MESAAKGLCSVIAAQSTGIVVVQIRTVRLHKDVRLSLALAGRNELERLKHADKRIAGCTRMKEPRLG